MSIDVHAREARAERRWARRGASLPARFQHWLARAWPWAWRVRLDLVVLFHVASWLIFLTLARVIAPELILRTRGLVPDFAVGVAVTISALAALGFGIYWAYSASRSARLREAARYGDQPGIVLSSFVFLSLSFWIVAAGAAPYVDMARHPLYGHSIEQEILDRLVPAEQASERGMSPLVALAPRAHPSEQVCANASASDEVGQRDAFLCALSRDARRADLWRTLAFDRAYEEWRADPDFRKFSPESLEKPVFNMDVYFAAVESEGTTAYVMEPGYVISTDIGDPELALGEGVIRFASENAPWNARIASVKPWQRITDIWNDPAVIIAFARSQQFQALVDRQFLFREYASWRIPNLEAADAEQWTARDQVMGTPAFARALATGEQAFVGAGPPPALFSHAEWTHLSMIRAQIFAGFRAAREAASSARPSETIPPQSAAPPTMSLEIWRELEADPAQHSAFVASLQYGQWKLAYLYALISKGALNREVRSLPYRKTVESYLRAALTHPATAPEAVLLQELSQRVMALGGIFFSAALVLALFTVGLNQVGIGGIFGAVGLSAILAIVHALLGSVISALSLYGDMQQYWIWTGAISLTLAPLGIVASAILAGRRNRFSGFFAAISVATATIWAPVWLVKLLSENLRFDFVNRLLEDLISFGAIAFVVIAFASLVTSLLALVYRLPRAV